MRKKQDRTSLSETNTTKVSNKEEKLALIKAGLGPKKIQFYADDSEEVFQQKLVGQDGFPKLSHCGGFELMRCSSNCRDLAVFFCHRTPEIIKTFVGCQSKIYIRPIQHSLSMDPDNSLFSEAAAILQKNAVNVSKLCQ